MTLENAFYNGVIPHLMDIGLVVASIWSDAVSTMVGIKKDGISGERSHQHREGMQNENPHHYLAKSAAGQSLIIAGGLGAAYFSVYGALPSPALSSSEAQLTYVLKELPTYFAYILAAQNIYITLHNLAGYLDLDRMQRALAVPINQILRWTDPKGIRYRQPAPPPQIS